MIGYDGYTGMQQSCYQESLYPSSEWVPQYSIEQGQSTMPLHTMDQWWQMDVMDPHTMQNAHGRDSQHSQHWWHHEDPQHSYWQSPPVLQSPPNWPVHNNTGSESAVDPDYSFDSFTMIQPQQSMADHHCWPTDIPCLSQSACNPGYLTGFEHEHLESQAGLQPLNDTGYVLHCSPGTRNELFGRSLCGAPNAQLTRMMNFIEPGTRLFVFEPATHKLYGPLIAAGMPGENLERRAWKGQYPAQVRFHPNTVVKCIHAPALFLKTGPIDPFETTELENQLCWSNSKSSSRQRPQSKKKVKQNRKKVKEQHPHRETAISPLDQAEKVADRKIKNLERRIKKIEATKQKLECGESRVQQTNSKQPVQHRCKDLTQHKKA